jgi:hypothetical protein
MNRIATFILVSLLGCGIVLAAGYNQWDASLLNCSNTITRTDTSPRLTGKINSIVVVGPSAWTGAVTVVNQWRETYFSRTCSGTNTYRPRFTTHANTGVTRGVTNEWEMPLIVQDVLTVRIVNASRHLTNDVSVKVILE